MNVPLSLGKLPPDLLKHLLAPAPQLDPRILMGPGLGLDCAILDLGDRLLVFKSDPITFATDQIGWYAVQINANDISTTGAEPSWMLVTLMLPEGKATAQLAEDILGQVYSAARELGISVVGGHTEVTYGLDRPIISAALIGEVDHEHLITPRGARPGNLILLTKGVPVEGTALLAREFPERLRQHFSENEIHQAQDYLTQPGISVVRDSRIARQSGRVTSMHDPTEGGLGAALWELAEASGCLFEFDPQSVPVPELAGRVCQLFGLDPLATIGSGALLMTAEAEDVPQIVNALKEAGILCGVIGRVQAGEPAVWAVTPRGRSLYVRPMRDDITRVFE